MIASKIPAHSPHASVSPASSQTALRTPFSLARMGRGARIQRSIGDGHDLDSPRMAGNPVYEAVYDNERYLRWGSRGRNVRHLQQMLIDLGYDLSNYGADGHYENETTAAVRAFQTAEGLRVDGIVGEDTIKALNDHFPAFTLPANRRRTDSLDCIKHMLCPWNRNLVENVFSRYSIVFFTTRTYRHETWDGSRWVTGTFHSGGFHNRGSMRMGFKKTNCERMAFALYHEGWHAQQPSSLQGAAEREPDAYINSEQWSIDVGIPGQTFRDRSNGGARTDLRQTVRGRTEVDEGAANRLVRQAYGGVSATGRERVIARVGADQVRVIDSSGHRSVRNARRGDRVKIAGSDAMTGVTPVPAASWTCRGITY